MQARHQEPVTKAAKVSAEAYHLCRMLCVPVCFVVMQARNEELVTKAAKVSEEDMAAVQAECERRLGAAERKVYALAKERDALRRGSDKLSSANDLLKEKDNIIAQVRPLCEYFRQTFAC